MCEVVYYKKQPYTKSAETLSAGAALDWAERQNTDNVFLISDSCDVWTAMDILDSQGHNLQSEGPFFYPSKTLMISWHDLNFALLRSGITAAERQKIKSRLGWAVNDD